jgi:hypothetical protein
MKNILYRSGVVKKREEKKQRKKKVDEQLVTIGL